MTVKRGDLTVTQPQWGSALPVDGGEHNVVASAPGYQTWQTTVSVADERASEDVTIPPLVKGSAEPEPGGGSPSGGEPYDATPQIIAGSAVGLVGLVGIGVGIGFAVIAKDKDGESLGFCDPNDPTSCNETGVALRDEARQAQTISIVSFVAGGALTLTGALLVITGVLMHDPPREAGDVRFTPTLSSEQAGFSLSGRF
jgi:serine/threonine-protein kinase